MTMPKSVVNVLNLGRISYGHALKIQERCVRQRLDSPSKFPNVLLLCEHDPVYTIGIRQSMYSPVEERRLKNLGAEFYRTNRGGLITFHGPGQLVCYPILNLGCFTKSVRWYVYQLEKTVIDLCWKFGIKASTSPNTGVWVGDNKICAIGINCRMYVTSHGFALNCDTDMRWFENIVPCGIVGKGVTSLSQELRRKVTVPEAIPPLLESFAENFNCSLSFEDVDGNNSNFSDDSDKLLPV